MESNTGSKTKRAGLSVKFADAVLLAAGLEPQVVALHASFVDDLDSVHIFVRVAMWLAAVLLGQRPLLHATAGCLFCARLPGLPCVAAGATLEERSRESLRDYALMFQLVATAMAAGGGSSPDLDLDLNTDSDLCVGGRFGLCLEQASAAIEAWELALRVRHTLEDALDYCREVTMYADHLVTITRDLAFARPSSMSSFSPLSPSTVSLPLPSSSSSSSSSPSSSCLLPLPALPPLPADKKGANTVMLARSSSLASTRTGPFDSPAAIPDGDVKMGEGKDEKRPRAEPVLAVLETLVKDRGHTFAHLANKIGGVHPHHLQQLLDNQDFRAYPLLLCALPCRKRKLLNRGAAWSGIDYHQFCQRLVRD